MAAKPGPFRLNNPEKKSVSKRRYPIHHFKPRPLSPKNNTAPQPRELELAHYNRPLSEEEVAEKVINPFRCFDCKNYETCLNLTAVLNWHSFTCKGCNGIVEPKLIWRAHQELKNNNNLKEICPLPKLL